VVAIGKGYLSLIDEVRARVSREMVPTWALQQIGSYRGYTDRQNQR
jgi:hypothetical protein